MITIIGSILYLLRYSQSTQQFNIYWGEVLLHRITLIIISIASQWMISMNVFKNVYKS